MGAEARWTINVCPKCNGQLGQVPGSNQFGHQHIDGWVPGERVEVILADAPNVLTKGEARLLARWLDERPCAGNATQAIQEELQARLRNFAEGKTDA